MANPLSKIELNWTSIGVSLLFAGYFLGFGLFLPYFPLYLEALSFSPVEIALFVSLPNIIKIVATPVTTSLSDRAGRRRHSLAFYGVICALCFFSLVVLDGYWSIFAVVVIVSICHAPMQPLADAYAFEAVKVYGSDYGFMRSWGSVAFIVATLFGGWYLSVFSPISLQAFTALGFLVAALVALKLPGMPSEKKEHNQQAPWRAPALRNWPIHGFLLAVGLLLGSLAALYSFGSIYWLANGLSDGTVGILWSVGVVAEILVFMKGRVLLERMGPLMLVMVGGASAVLRWMLFPHATDVTLAVIVQLLHGANFGMVHLGMTSYLAEVVEGKYLGTVQGAAQTYIGLILGVAAIGTGWLYTYDPAVTFYAMAVMSVVGMALLALIWKPLQLVPRAA